MGTAATTDPQQNPSSRSMPPPAGSSRGARPLMSPTFSRKAFPPAEPASASTAIVVSEPRRVTLDEWWLAKVEGHGNFGVAGFFERNGVVREFCAEPISKRYAPCTLETENGTILFLHGFFNVERAIQNGYTIIACEKFCIGFPHWWDKWHILYPRMMDSQTSSQPNPSTTTNSRENKVECIDDETEVPINSTSLINKEYQNALMDSFECIAVHDKAVLGEVKDEPSSEKGKDPVGPSRKQRSTFIKSPHATRLPNIQSSIAHDNRLTRSRSKSLTAYSPEYLNLSKTKSGRVVVPALDSGCQNIVYDKDGSISAISGIDLQSPLKGTGSPLKVYTKKKRTN